MDDTVIAKHLENLDHRLENVEQILQRNVDPRLANVESSLTRVDTRLTAVDTRLTSVESRLTRVETSLTSVDMRLSTVEQILPALATTQALHTTEAALSLKIREEGERSRRYMDITRESLHSDIQLIAEHLASIMPKGAGS